MNIENNITRFETELAKVDRPGMDKLLEYIRKSDFYKAPASTKYHLACPGGLLQHSLNVLDALRGLLDWNSAENAWEYRTAGQTVDAIPDDSVIIMALLHDLCKTYFYSISYRNAKNAAGNWEKVPYYTVLDRMPLGHGPKSVMLIKEYTTLTSMEMYAIWHHMGRTGDFENDSAVGKSMEMYPAVLALQTADMMASRFMESEQGNIELFAELPVSEEGTEFQEAPPQDKEVEA